MDEDSLTPSKWATKNKNNKFAGTELDNCVDADYDIITNETPIDNGIVETANKILTYLTDSHM